MDVTADMNVQVAPDGSEVLLVAGDSPVTLTLRLKPDQVGDLMSLLAEAVEIAGRLREGTTR